jgi:hypothetical protein
LTVPVINRLRAGKVALRPEFDLSGKASTSPFSLSRFVTWRDALLRTGPFHHTDSCWEGSPLVGANLRGVNPPCLPDHSAGHFHYLSCNSTPLQPPICRIGRIKSIKRALALVIPLAAGHSPQTASDWGAMGRNKALSCLKHGPHWYYPNGPRTVRLLQTHPSSEGRPNSYPRDFY